VDGSVGGDDDEGAHLPRRGSHVLASDYLLRQSRRRIGGLVGLLAVRKDHGKPTAGVKRGDALQLILIQVKGGTAARPTAEDAARLRAVARRHHARHVLLAKWKRGSAARFYRLRHPVAKTAWSEVAELEAVFR
jgi:hypothetical protein